MADDTPPPPLREELKMRKLVQQGEVVHIVKEPDKGAYYRFDEEQYLMLTLFDGQKTPDQLVKAFDEASDEYEYDLEALYELINTARDYQLLKRNRQEMNAALIEKMKSDRKGMRLQMQGSLMHMRFQLVDPDKFFDSIIDKIRFIWSPAGVIFSFVVIFAALVAVSLNADRFMAEVEKVMHMATSSGWGLFGIWVVALTAIAFHEIWHGLTCKHFGGEVHEIGFLLMAFQPCLYCNVNDAWLFEDTRHKIYVALAGVWVELFIGALAGFVWLVVDVNNIIGTVCFILMLIATASSLFMNLNPLMKFDGYYILSDYLEVPNLRDNATAWFSYSLKSKVLRMDIDPPLYPSNREKRIYFTYGGLTALYMTSMLGGLALMLHGTVADSFGFLGILVYLFLVYKITVMITGTWAATIKEWIRVNLWGNHKRRLILGGVGGFFVLLMFIWSPRIMVVTEGKIAADSLPLHAPENGFVTAVGYGDDRHLTVRPGEPLFTIDSPDLNLERTRLLARRDGLDLDRIMAMSSREPGRMRRVLIDTRTVIKELATVEHRILNLSLPAPTGFWVADGPPPVTLKGRYFSRGEVVFSLIPGRARLISVILDQSDLNYVREGQNAWVRVGKSAPEMLPGIVRRVSPVAKMDGPNRLFQVRVDVVTPLGMEPPIMDMACEVKILGEERPFWEHLLRPIRKTFRVDLWV